MQGGQSKRARLRFPQAGYDAGSARNEERAFGTLQLDVWERKSPQQRLKTRGVNYLAVTAPADTTGRVAASAMALPNSFAKHP
jgi:hypothetical protein